jgi:hypothetical protein
MLPLILAAAGAIKGDEDAQEAARQKQAEAIRDAAMIRYSPWSGIDANKFAGKSYATPSATSQGLAGALSGYQGGADIKNSQADQAYRKQVADYYTQKNANGSFTPWGQLSNQHPLGEGDLQFKDASGFGGQSG